MFFAMFVIFLLLMLYSACFLSEKFHRTVCITTINKKINLYLIIFVLCFLTLSKFRSIENVRNIHVTKHFYLLKHKK